MDLNPYESPQAEPQTRRAPLRLAKKFAAAILVAGLAALAYGACGFWVFRALPPNNGWSGRLPSLYIMGAGMAAAIVGLLLSSFQTPKTQSGRVPTGVGFLIIAAALIALVAVVMHFR